MRSIARKIAALCTYRCGRHVCTLTFPMCRLLGSATEGGGLAVDGGGGDPVPSHKNGANTRVPAFHRSSIVDQGERLDIVNNRYTDGTLRRGAESRATSRTWTRRARRRERGGDWSSAGGADAPIGRAIRAPWPPVIGGNSNLI